jgi:hypothetical protein
MQLGGTALPAGKARNEVMLAGVGIDRNFSHPA